MLDDEFDELEHLLDQLVLAAEELDDDRVEELREEILNLIYGGY